MSFIITLIYLAAGICFIMGLKYLGKTHTARKGNLVSATGMGLAVVGTALKIYEIQGGAIGFVFTQYLQARF